MKRALISLVIAATVLVVACDINTDPQTEPVTETATETVVTSETTTESTSETTTVETTEPVPEKEYFVFGHYEQDGNKVNGPEPIEWEVLAEEDGKMLLISRYILDCKPYATPKQLKKAVTWNICYLRSWLNKDFYNKAFDKAEKGKILTSKLKNPGNPVSKVKGSKDTDDKVFVLSVEEILNYYEFNYLNEEIGTGYCQAIIAEATPYAISQNIFVYTIKSDEAKEFLDVGYSEDLTGREFSYWWLRSVGEKDTYVCYAGARGYVGWNYNYYAGMVSTGVRPAVWIKVD